MKKKLLNKNKITKLNLNIKKTIILSKNSYFYYFFNKLKNRMIDLKNLKSIVIFILQCNKNSRLKINKNYLKIKKNQIVIIENIHSKLFLNGSGNTILLAGTKNNKYKKKIN